jgi:predicted O-methyltransferase YrrM
MGLGPHSYEFVESYIAEDPVLQSARARAAEIGLTPIRPGGGAALRLLASAAGAKAVVEVGTGTGVSGGWLLRGMRPDGVLTTIDIEPEHQRQARLTFREGGFAPGKTRLIAGRALDVLPRLADGAYDLVFIDGDKSEYAQCVAELWGGRVPDPAARDPESVALREVVKSMRDADEWLPALLPVGDGLLCAVKNGDGQR